MTSETVQCQHSCKANCQAIDAALEAEKSAILEYSLLRDQCTFPDVIVLLNSLIIERMKSIGLLEQTRERVCTSFAVLDQIREGYETV